MSLKNVDIGAVMRRLADKRIEDAMKEGKFDNLAGAGKPLDLEPMPAEEGARMMWWALRIMKQNDVIPDEIRYRKAIDHLKAALHRATVEAQIREIVKQINELVYKLNTMGTNAIRSEIAPLDADEECQRLRRKAS